VYAASVTYFSPCCFFLYLLYLFAVEFLVVEFVRLFEFKIK
jgi:hypothetical protein